MAKVYLVMYCNDYDSDTIVKCFGKEEKAIQFAKSRRDEKFEYDKRIYSENTVEKYGWGNFFGVTIKDLYGESEYDRNIFWFVKQLDVE